VYPQQEVCNLLDDTLFCDALSVHTEPLKVKKERERRVGGESSQRFLQMRDVPVQVVAMEAYDTMFESQFQHDFRRLQHYETLYTREVYNVICEPDTLLRKYAYRWLLVVKQRMFERKWTALLCQVCMALVAMQHQYDMVHNDMHGQNIMLAPTTDTHLHYQVGDTHYRVPTFGYIVKVIDLGRTTFQMKETMYMGDVFADRGEAGEQYSYIHYYTDAVDNQEAREHLLLPNACFDLTRLACSLLDEFYGTAGVRSYDGEYDEQFPLAEDESEMHKMYTDALFCRPTTSGFYNMLCEWITDCYKEPVNRFDNFDLYKQIARRMRSTIPLHQLKRPHFAVFEVAREADKQYYNLTQNRFYTKSTDCSVDRPVYDSDNETYKHGTGTDDDDDDDDDRDGDSELGMEQLNMNDLTDVIQSLCQQLTSS
jgi:hypothetical protein